MTRGDPSGLSLHLEKVLPAPRAHVFAAFVDKSALAAWWGPNDFTVPKVEICAREGERYRLTMQPPEGAAFHIAGEFREVDPPQRLVYTFEYEEPDPDDQETLVTLSFVAVAAGTMLVLDQGPFATKARRALHATGWAETLDGLERFLALGVHKLRIGGTAMTVKSDAWRGKRIKKTGTTVRYETRTTIDRPIDEVFARLANLDGYRTWMHRTGLFRRTGQTSDGPRGQGTAYFDATRMGTFRGQITDYQPPSQIGFRETLRWFGSDLMEARPEYLLEADRDRTIVHHIAEGELFGLMRLLKPVAALLARSERTRTLTSLKRSLESG